MKIGIDCRMIGHPGIGRYISNLLASLLEMGSGHKFLLYGDTAELSDFKPPGNVELVKWTAPVYSAAEQAGQPFRAKGPDILHIPHFNIPLFYKGRMVVTIHDLTYILYPDSAPSRSARMYARFMIGRALKKSGGIIAVSENTKIDILKTFPATPKNRVTVIHEAADPVFSAQPAERDAKYEPSVRQQLPERYLLHVGTLKAHKNIGSLLEAWKLFKKRGMAGGFDLVFVGASKERESHLREEIKEAGALYLGTKTSDELASIYRGASVVVVPSCYEGFGLPVVEAMASGVPVIAANATSLPEVGGDAALYFDPSNPAELASAIERVLSDKRLSSELSKKGLDRASRFSWRDTAEKTLRLYEEASSRSIAISYDWLTGMRGGEKCLEAVCELFPRATIFTLLHEKGSVSSVIEAMDIRASILQRMPFITRFYRYYLPLYPLAVRSFNLSGYDLILSMSHCAAKNIRKPRGAVHICYCFTPARYLWKFFDEYFGQHNPPIRGVISMMIRRLRRWDLEKSRDIDRYITLSKNVQKFIEECYNKSSDLIYPPVDTDLFRIGRGDGGFYLAVSALVPYKRVDLAVEAFNMLGTRLVIVGDGPLANRLRKTAAGNIDFRGWVSNGKLAELYGSCRALIFPGEEDFGIVPIEAQACGRPVIAYGKGGVLETAIPLRQYSVLSTQYSAERQYSVLSTQCSAESDKNQSPTGVFFHEQTAKALIDAVEEFERNEQLFNPENIRANALRFGRERFKKEIKEYIDSYGLSKKQ